MIDNSIIGSDLGATRFPVERSKLAELARAYHDEDPVWHEPGAARAAGFDETPVPPTVTVLADHWRKGGALAPALALGIEPDRLLHGEASWEYLAPIRTGDELTASARVTDVSTRQGKRGGTMTLVTLQTDFRNQDGTLAVRRKDTLIETGAGDGSR